MKKILFITVITVLVLTGCRREYASVSRFEPVIIDILEGIDVEFITSFEIWSVAFDEQGHQINGEYWQQAKLLALFPGLELDLQVPLQQFELEKMLVNYEYADGFEGPRIHVVHEPNWQNGPLGGLRFNYAGTYVFEIWQTIPADIADEWRISNAFFTIIVTVTEDFENNVLVATTESAESVLIFESVYVLDVTDAVQLAVITQREPVSFCGLADPDYATGISNEEALDYLVLVNRCQRMNSDFEPHDLRSVDVPQINNWSGNHYLRDSAATALEELFVEINAISGMNLVLSSAYRSYELQTFFHTNAVNNMGRDEARRVSAVPGHSEHQLGLAADVTVPSIGLTNAFANTAEGVWIRENAHRFGFIVSYPYGRTEDTGFIYEPWHLRFVGIDVATVIFERNLILEEFLWYYN